MNKQLLINLHQYPEFQMLVKELNGFRPIVPSYDPKTDNTRDMAFHSTRQQMFDTIMSVINPFDKPIN